MFCDKCGNRLPEGSKFCDACGNRMMLQAQPTAQAVRQPVQQTNKRSGAWKIAVAACVGGIVVVGIIVVVCVTMLAESKPLTVDEVKNSTLNSYSNMTVGEAFESYFMFPEWKELQVTETDYYVMFTGYIYSSYYGDVKTEIVFYNDATCDESGYFTLLTVALTPESTGSRREISDSEMIDLLDDVYYGDSFSWLSGP
ncbi:MAG: zinc ribbon domain-containing protein [Oscillospiraceae bacterium]|nr:zinc ribbon domain-containing protein [Oscillospiraceae bacterium]